MTDRILLLESEGFADYALLDSGAGRKLERYGRITVDRPEPQAMGRRRLDDRAWARADGVFDGDDEGEKGKWSFRGTPPESWDMTIDGITAICRFSGFRHLGVFAEQYPHWQWMLGRLAGTDQPRLLNLFGYTGVASLLAAAAGARVTHVDASRKAIGWARENQARSGLEDAPIRWLLEDARKFAEREVRRGRTYHGILCDPPKFGRGPNNEVWDLFRDLPPMLDACARLLAPQRSFLVLTTYAVRASSLAMANLAGEVLADRDGRLDSGELVVREQGGGRPLATSLFVRWVSRDLADD